MERPRVLIRLLGGVEAVAADGTPVDLGPAKCRTLLAALALSAGSAVPRWRLVELMWGDESPRTAERTLQSYVARLRGSLGTDVIERTGTAYRLALSAEAVDAIRFERHLDAGDVDAALEEWSGYPLAGLAAPGLDPTVDRLVERWLGAIETSLTARVETDAASTVGELTELCSRHPFRERLWALLITALYRVGRQADALAAYRTAREQLIEQLGLEPGPRLRELESLVLSQDRRMGIEQQVPRRGGGLPRRTTRLIGRDDEMDVTQAALVDSPVVTLVGPGGIGKTALAVAVARRHTGRAAWLIDLTEISAPQGVPPTVAAALGVKEGPNRSLSESIVAALRSDRALLVLDNCEHVVDGVARLVQAIADDCPEVRVLATSREGLGLGHHERFVAVPPLAPDGAGAELFNERASALSVGFDAVRNRRVVEQICRRLDGLPLAIELAAARSTTLTPPEVLARLDDQLRLLVGRQRTGTGRHRTMRAAIEWSYGLLDPTDQALFRLLSVFVGSFGADAAAAISVDSGIDVDDGLRSLVERSMLAAEPGPFGQRFRLLEPIRQFAAELLRINGEYEPATDAHTRYCRDWLSHIHEMLSGRDELEGVSRLDELWPNLRVAVERACAAKEPQVAHELVRLVASEGALRHRQEIGHWAERLLTITLPDDNRSVAFALTAAAPSFHLRKDPEGYDELASRHSNVDEPAVRHARAHVHDDFAAQIESARPAAAELRRIGVDDLAEQVEVDLAAALVFQGHFRRGDRHLDRLIGRYRDQGPPTLLNWTLMLRGFSAAFQGDRDRSEALFDEALEVPIPERSHSPNRAVRARGLFRRGDRPEAYRMLCSQVDELLDTDNMQGTCVVAVEFTTMMAAAGRLEDSARMLGFLDATGFLDNSGWAALVEETRSTLADSDLVVVQTTPIRDHRHALAHMHSRLDELINAECGPGSC